MKQPRMPQKTASRIVVDDQQAKEKLIEIGEKTGETLKEIIVRLIEFEFVERGLEK